MQLIPFGMQIKTPGPCFTCFAEWFGGHPHDIHIPVMNQGNHTTARHCEAAHLTARHCEAANGTCLNQFKIRQPHLKNPIKSRNKICLNQFQVRQLHR
jgi:hypothetical protein